MSTIIECPACSTRYKMNKDIPEGGRNVKCARCGNQWRLAPEGYVEQTIELDEPEHNPVASQAHEAPMPTPEAMAAQQPEAPMAAPERPAFTSWQTRREQLGGAISTLSEPQVAGYGQPAPAADTAAVRSSWRDAAPDEAEEPSAPFGMPEPNAAPVVSWSFRDTVEAPADEAADEEEDASGAPGEAAPEEGASAGWGGRINRPWREIVEASRASTAEHEEEDAEVAIREALKAALEHPIEDGARAGLFQQQGRARAETSSAEVEPTWNRFAHADAAPHAIGAEDAYDEDFAETEIDADPDLDEDDARTPFTIPGHNAADDGEDDENDAPFRLTGLSARLPVYEADDAEDTYKAEAGEGVDAAGDSFRNDIEDAFRAAPLLKRPFEAAPERAEASLPDFGKIYDEHDLGEEAGAGFYDERAAAEELQAELESTDLTSYEGRRAGGGLAVAAAWAVFFSVVSGVALAAVTLRSDIMAALPGTTSLYRAIGFDVAESGIDFADVSYRWTVAQGKPMIEVKGQVVNITDRRLTVPRVLINVRDGSSSDAVKVTASVPTESLAPKESASFTLEFVSPPKNISQIELEFDRNR